MPDDFSTDDPNRIIPLPGRGPAAPRDPQADLRRLALTGHSGAGRMAPVTDGDLCALVDRYWRGLRHGRVAPLRSDVDPRAIAAALPYVLIAERLAPGIARLRIAGSELNDLLGMEARGMPLTVFAEPEARKLLSSAIEDVCASPAIVEMRLTGPASYGRPALSGRLMLWPLVSETGKMDRLLGCLVPVGETGRAPRRFQVGLPRRHLLDGPGGQSAVTQRPLAEPGRPLRGLAEPPAAFFAGTSPTDHLPAIRRRGHLRLVKSDV